MLGMLFGALMGSAAGWFSAIPVVLILLFFVVVTLNDVKRTL
jgi:membrane-associated protease RseP (regulator of RpoE activity)